MSEFEYGEFEYGDGEFKYGEPYPVSICYCYEKLLHLCGIMVVIAMEICTSIRRRELLELISQNILI